MDTNIFHVFSFFLSFTNETDRENMKIPVCPGVRGRKSHLLTEFVSYIPSTMRNCVTVWLRSMVFT